jgi:hypothetical protein
MLFMMKAMHGSKKNQAVEPKPAPPLGDADQA